MRDLERKITKLEQQNGLKQQEITALLDQANLNIFERIEILYSIGLITGEMIAGWIKNGSKKIKDKEVISNVHKT